MNTDELLTAGGYPGSDFLPDYANRVAAGTFRVPVAQPFRLDEWRDAAHASLSGAPHGKIVLVP